MDQTKKGGLRTVKDRKEIGLELRKTHFMLGNDGINEYLIFLDKKHLSQYRNDYPEHKINQGLGPNMDSVLLRRTHFKLGDYKNPYSTTNAEQNKNVENMRARSTAALDQNAKNDLRKSHFILGNFDPTYKTVFQQEYYDKSGMNDPNRMANAKNIEKTLRSHNYILGSDKPEYQSETQDRFVYPDSSKIPRSHQKISTHELQKSHYSFGNMTDPWASTTQLSYYPKEVQVKRLTKDLTRTNFILGEDKGNLTTVNQGTYVPHKIVKSGENKDLAQDLRSNIILLNLLEHHFSFGNENADNMTTINKQDYADPKIDNAQREANKISNLLLRASHFSLGDKSQMPPDQYATTYSTTMMPRDANPNARKPNNSFKSSVIINGEGANNYLTETRAK